MAPCPPPACGQLFGIAASHRIRPAVRRASVNFCAFYRCPRTFRWSPLPDQCNVEGGGSLPPGP
jgi:hypothetical protein